MTGSAWSVRECILFARGLSAPERDAMQKSKGNGYSRRQFGQVVFAGLPVSILHPRGVPDPQPSPDPLRTASATSAALQRIDSRVAGVQIGAQTYSFRTLASLDNIVKGMVTVGLG